MALRILASVIILLSLLFAPFWLSVLLILGAMIYFSFYWEGITLLFISDLLYGTQESRFFEITIFSTIIAFVTLITIEYLKKKLKFRI